jgi:hypothetical protein
MEKWNKEWHEVCWGAAVRKGPFIGSGRQWRGEEMVAGTVGIKSFGFEVVKDVGEVGWHRFGGGNEGGDSMLRFVFLRLREDG